MNRQEKHLRFEQHRDNADDLLRAADAWSFQSGSMQMTALATQANAHATLALVYLTDLLSDR